MIRGSQDASTAGRMRLTPEQRELLPSDDDVAFYHRHGYYISKPILPDELLDAAVDGALRHFSGERDVRLPVTTGYSDWKPGGSVTFRNCEYVALQTYKIRRLVEYPLIGAIAARLCGSDEVRLFDDQLIYKAPNPADTSAVVGWHVDRAYWMTCTSDNMLTAWIPFHDCPEEMGPLLVVDGSHRFAGNVALRTFNEHNLEELESRYRSADLPFRRVCIPLTRGQVSFHHCLTIHGSDINRGTRPRLSLAVHMQDGPNRYREYRNRDGIPWHLVNDELCRRTPEGVPDYTDPSVFPVLWSDVDRGRQQFTAAAAPSVPAPQADA
jgi:ectoine hydroxylase-related dioxygenase (phytanoyl-CoA dioxygenase family)